MTQPSRTTDSSGPAVGIDLGTTYSAIACLDDLQRPQTLANAEGEKLTPSAVLFDPLQVVVGREALKALVNEPEAVALLAKREMGDRYYHQLLDGRRYPPEVLQAYILNKLRLDATRQLGTFTRAVITVPAYFDEVRRKATQDAGYMAGLEVMDIINEPTAAALAFGFDHLPQAAAGRGKPQRLLVYDLGGGTFDVTVLEIDGADFTALATDGDVQLGGYDWDLRLMELVADTFRQQHGPDPREDRHAHARLWRECEDAKRTLSVRQRATVSCDYQGHTLHAEISRASFEDHTADLLERTRFTTQQTLAASGLEWQQVDRILLVGGATRMPSVRAMLEQMSGRPPDASISPDESVAHGAALRAGYLLQQRGGRPPRCRIRNVNSHSLGVVGTDPGTGRDRVAVIIPRNTPLPATARRTFRTKRAQQKSVLVRVVEGESTAPEDCVALGDCVVDRLPPDLPAQTPVHVDFAYADDGRLGVRVEIPAIGRRQQLELLRDNALSRAQRDAWRKHVSRLLPPGELPSELGSELT